MRKMTILLAALAVAAIGFAADAQANCIPNKTAATFGNDGPYVYWTVSGANEGTLTGKFVARAAPAGARGTAVAVYSTVQFLGAAFGSALGGFLMQHAGRVGLLGVNAALLSLWLAFAWGMQAPGLVGARSYPIPPMDRQRAHELSMRLSTLAGVREARVHGSAGIAYLKVDAKAFDERDVLKLIAGES